MIIIYLFVFILALYYIMSKLYLKYIIELHITYFTRNDDSKIKFRL